MCDRNSGSRAPLRLRFTLRHVFGAVALVALALPALIHASLWWAAAWLSGCLLALGISLLGILYRDAHRRAFWIGFALLGWGYMVFVYGPVLDAHVGHRLATSKLLAYIQPRLQRTPQNEWGWGMTSPGLLLEPDQVSLNTTVLPGQARGARLAAPQWDFFQQVGHSLFAILFAYVGGLVSTWFYATRSRP